MARGLREPILFNH
ncbi:hypothetical protein D049_1108A, partial [Vibrio parahaemolyticus VPTS-2010]